MDRESHQFVSAWAMLAALVGCTSGRTKFQEKLASYGANTPYLSAVDVDNFVTDQNLIMTDFARLASVSPAEGGEWRQVIDAGIHYVDVRCDRFMDALFWFNRMREVSSRQIQYTGAAVSAALAVLEASKNAIGLTPLGFSLFDQTVNNLGAGLLFNLNPSTVRVLVEKKQKAYLEALSSSYTSKAIALQVIQNYAAICLPPSIETEVERAITDREYEADVIVPKLPPAIDDFTPDALAFTTVPDAPPATLVVSDAVRVGGIGNSAPISISEGGEYQINQGEWTRDQGTVAPSAVVRVRVTSAATAGEAASTTLTIGGVPASFTVRTKEASAAVTGATLPEENNDETADDPPAPPVIITPEQNALPSPEPQ